MFNAGLVTTLPDGELLLRSAPERFVAWGVLFAVVMPVAFVLWRKGLGGRYAPGAFIVSFFVPLFVLPGIAMESVHLTEDALSIKTGFWFAPRVESHPLRGLAEITEHSVPRRRGGREIVWTLRYGPRSHRLDLPDLLESNRTPFVDVLKRRGIRVVPG